MSLTINVPLTTKDGGSVATGAHVQFETYFPAETLSSNVSIFLWRDLASKDGGMAQIRVNEITNLNFEKTYTEEDFALLTPVIINQEVKDYLETFVGVDNVSINS